MLKTPQSRIWFWTILGIVFLVLVLLHIIHPQGPVGEVVMQVGMVFLAAAQVAGAEHQKRVAPQANVRRISVRESYLGTLYFVLLVIAEVGIFGGILFAVLEATHVTRI